MKKKYPRIIFYWSCILQEAILKSKYTFPKIQKFTYSFEKYFRKYEKNILKDIEKYTGFKWKSNIIYVWFIEGYYMSIPEPILINVYNYKKDFVLFQLINLLIHRNLIEN
ncbi:MAG: hypothetical protein ACTSVV_06845, partial [Promethearchaeota archaeon]